jgi:hypothetical protein
MPSVCIGGGKRYALCLVGNSAANNGAAQTANNLRGS